MTLTYELTHVNPDTLVVHGAKVELLSWLGLLVAVLVVVLVMRKLNEKD